MRQFTKIMLALLCTFTLAVVVTPLIDSAHAAVNSTPNLTTSRPTAPIQADGCVKFTLIGSGFTPGNKISFLVPDGNHFYDFTRTTPDIVSPDKHGNFALAVETCVLSADFSQINPLTILAAKDGYAEIFNVLAGTQITLTSPDPTIHALSNTVSVDFGCANVRIVGNGFVPSTFLTNRFLLIPLNAPFGPEYAAGNVLGGGNIAISFSICRVKPGQTITISAWDLASRKFSNIVTVQTVRFR